MLTNHEPDWNIEDLTPAEIYAAIRYLEQPPSGANEGNNHIATTKQNDDKGALICVGLYLLLMFGLGLWFYWR